MSTHYHSETCAIRQTSADTTIFMAWHIYIIECIDGSLYTGITNDLEKRITAHNEGRGAKYTKSRRPVILRYSELVASRTSASKREYAIKTLSRAAKLELIQSLCAAR